MHLFTPKDHTIHMTTPSTAIGYIRVSTDMQNEGDYALERQAEKIRRSCAERGITLTTIYEDTASAVDAFSLERRPSLTEATARAARENACLIVPEPTRLFRNVEVAESWLDSHDVPVFSVRDNMILTRSQILEAVEAGAKVAQATSDGTVDALNKKRAADVTLGSKADRTAANAASKRARAQGSSRVVDTIARVLLEDQAYRDLSHRALADLLNRRRILTGWKRPWTADGIKRQRKLAEARIQEWIDIEDEDVSAEYLATEVEKPEPAPVLEPQTDEEIMKALPNYGKF